MKEKGKGQRICMEVHWGRSIRAMCHHCFSDSKDSGQNSEAPKQPKSMEKTKQVPSCSWCSLSGRSTKSRELSQKRRGEKLNYHELICGTDCLYLFIQLITVLRMGVWILFSLFKFTTKWHRKGWSFPCCRVSCWFLFSNLCHIAGKQLHHLQTCFCLPLPAEPQSALAVMFFVFLLWIC